jgi:preprotein translocase subunit SecA
VLLATGEQSKLLLELSYDSALKLTGALWTWVERAEIPPEVLPKLEADAERLRVRRVAAAKSKGKIGRNDLCPCGSGRKYKNCCLRLERVR